MLDDAILRSYATLRHNDFAKTIVAGWIKQRNEVLRKLETATETIVIGRLQGESRTLGELIDNFETARETLETRAASRQRGGNTD